MLKMFKKITVNVDKQSFEGRAKRCLYGIILAYPRNKFSKKAVKYRWNMQVL